MENFEAGDEWSIYRAAVGSDGTGTYSLVKAAHATATYSDTITSGTRYKWRAAISIAQSTEVINTSTEVINTSTEFIFKNEPNQKGSPRYSNP